MFGRRRAGEAVPSAEALRLVEERIGFVFQQYNLLPTLTVLENVVLPLKLAGRRFDTERAGRILEQILF
ncbi:hypothetical protein [Salinispora vitiensis]|uniref:hypothetical protein n=1 Tax=Salinispora vitiensis TaxID=999544 RepID=UPI00036943AE